MSGKLENLIAENCAPPNVEYIGIYNGNSKQGKIKIPQRMRYPLGEKLYSFCALSDVHITYDTANEDFQRALTFVEKSDCAFTCICGDLTNSGTDDELVQYKTSVDSYAKTKPVYAISGNHEALNGAITYEQMTPYTGYPLYYSFTHEEDVFLMVGTYQWLNSELLSVDELQWLYETLEANRNKRCFVFEHVFPWGGSGNANGLYQNNIFSATRGTVFENLMKHYKNVILFHGHSHLRFNLQTADKTANYSAKDGYRSVHIPSISVPRDVVDNKLSVLYAESEGYIVDVFESCIVLRGRDFVDNGKDGVWLPIATYKIDTTLQTVEAETFTDSTGTITV